MTAQAQAEQHLPHTLQAALSAPPAKLPCLCGDLGETFLKLSLWQATGHSRLQMGSLHNVKKVLNNQIICVQ